MENLLDTKIIIVASLILLIFTPMCICKKDCQWSPCVSAAITSGAEICELYDLGKFTGGLRRIDCPGYSERKECCKGGESLFMEILDEIFEWFQKTFGWPWECKWTVCTDGTLQEEFSCARDFGKDWKPTGKAKGASYCGFNQKRMECCRIKPVK